MLLTKLVSMLVIVSFTLGSITPVFAQEIDIPQPPDPISGEVDVGKAISPLQKDQRAPFTGVLLSPDALADIIVELKSIDDQIQLEVDKAIEELEAHHEFELRKQQIELETTSRILEVKLESEQEQNRILLDRLKTVEDNKPDIVLWTAGGFIGGITLTAGVVFLVANIVN